MKRIFLAVGLCVLGSGWAVAGALRVPPRTPTPPELLGALDPDLAGVARELHARVTKDSAERSLQWTARDGATMHARIQVEQVQGKPKLRVTMEASRDLALPAHVGGAEMSQSFNLQYLDLQQQMQDENRRFSLISNIMKNKHDTSKSSIGNVR